MTKEPMSVHNSVRLVKLMDFEHNSYTSLSITCCTSVDLQSHNYHSFLWISSKVLTILWAILVIFARKVKCLKDLFSNPSSLQKQTPCSRMENCWSSYLLPSSCWCDHCYWRKADTIIQQLPAHRSRWVQGRKKSAQSVCNRHRHRTLLRNGMQRLWWA